MEFFRTIFRENYVTMEASERTEPRVCRFRYGGHGFGPKGGSKIPPGVESADPFMHRRPLDSACQMPRKGPLRWSGPFLYGGGINMAQDRPDKEGSHQLAFKRNKKKILATQTVCGICGRPVDKSLKYPHPMSATVDHIIPVARGGHPSDIENLQLAHFTCNRQKSDKLYPGEKKKRRENETLSNRVLPWSCDWRTYRA